MVSASRGAALPGVLVRTGPRRLRDRTRANGPATPSDPLPSPRSPRLGLYLARPRGRVTKTSCAVGPGHPGGLVGHPPRVGPLPRGPTGACRPADRAAGRGRTGVARGRRTPAMPASRARSAWPSAQETPDMEAEVAQGRPVRRQPARSNRSARRLTVETGRVPYRSGGPLRRPTLTVCSPAPASATLRA